MVRRPRITTLRGDPATRLGLAAYAGQDPACVRRALDHGVNYFFFYGPNHGGMAKAARWP